MDRKQFWRIFLDPSLYLLLGANAFVVWNAWQQHLTMADVYWAYWAQSVIMIFAWTFRLQEMGYTTPGSAADLGMSISVTTFSGDIKDEYDYTGVQGFLLFALGFFLLYIPFLFMIVGLPNWEPLLWMIPGFGVAHLTSYAYHKSSYRDGKEVMSAFAKRLIPVHLGIILGSGFAGFGGIALLSLLKTIVDVSSHAIEHATE